MSDFVNSFWSYFIAVIALGGIAWCVYLLFSQRAWLKCDVAPVQDTGHVWDGDLTELNNPVPRWWTVMYLALCIFALAYLILYPGLGSYQGQLGFSAGKQLQQEQEAFNERIRPIYEGFAAMSVPDIAGDSGAREIGQRLFLNNCAQCHGSDAKGGRSFPDLTDNDWLWGGAPEQILTSIAKGRHGTMPPWKAAIKPEQASQIAQYVRSMSGLSHDAEHLVAGKRGFDTFCVACHGTGGKGNTAMGAPNLTDGAWLHGSSEASIVETILEGRNNQMPAQERNLTPEQIRVLAAWVWGLSN